MKTLQLIIILCIVTVGNAYSQTFNRASLQKDQRHIGSVNAGLDYGVTFGLGYGYQLKTMVPVVLTAEYSMPSGKHLIDDFKVRIGGQVRWLRVGDFHFSTKVQGVFRRYENNYARLTNFGSDVSGAIGYYKPKWFVAGEVGFDKAIVAHFKHSDLMKENFAAKDGWYMPATGGNLNYGIQSGFSWRRHDLTVRAGRVISQDFKKAPLLPFYLGLGCNLRMR